MQSYSQSFQQYLLVFFTYKQVKARRQQLSNTEQLNSIKKETMNQLNRK